ncbi:MAG: undecaprenyl-diphosphate phosphatase [Clostridia bacterium]|nr:undecaprenyl-diphosphate phosphatase [Clostridia bacterium]
MTAVIEILKCIVLGLVQGLGEFLPISSSGHLLLTQRIFGVDEGGMLFTVLLHVATLAAVCIVYRRELWELIKHPIQWKTLWLIVATIMTVAVMLVFKKVFDAAEDGRFLGYCFLFTALLLTIAEAAKRRLARGVTCDSMKWHHAVLIGAMQGIAVLPGVSRSGATITGALLCGVKKKDAAEFSFLLSIPAILGGAVLEVPDLIKNGTGDFTWYGIVVGMLVAGVSGYFAVRFMLKLITKKSFLGFIIYTAALGAFLLLNQFVLHLF